MCPRINPDCSSLSRPTDPGLHSCYLGTSFATSGKAQLVTLQQWEKEHTLSLYGAEKPRRKASWDSSSKSCPQPFPITGYPSAQGWLLRMVSRTRNTHYQKPPLPPSCAGEAPYSARRVNPLPGVPSSQDLHHIQSITHIWYANPSHGENSSLSSQQAVQTPCEPLGFSLWESGRNRRTRQKFHLEVVEKRIYLKWVIWGADSS